MKIGARARAALLGLGLLGPLLLVSCSENDSPAPPNPGPDDPLATVTIDAAGGTLSHAGFELLLIPPRIF